MSCGVCTNYTLSDPSTCPECKGANPCYTQPTKICDPRWLALDHSDRVEILGVDGQCIKKLTRKPGFVVGDKFGQGITDRPIVPIPYHKAYATGGDGSILRDEQGVPVEAPAPTFHSLLISDSEGGQNRYQGTAGVPGRTRWNGTDWEFIAEALESQDNGKDLVRAPHIHQGVREVVMIETSEDTIIAGKCIPAIRRQLAYRTQSSTVIGGVIAFAGDSPPEGWVFCRGGLYSKTEYPAAFDAIGYNYGGSGDFFNVPDIRGRAIRGYDPETLVDKDAASRTALYSGGNTGANLGSYQDDAMQEHGHEGDEQANGYSLNIASSSTTIGVNGSKSITYLTTSTSLDTTEEDIEVCTIKKCSSSGDVEEPRTSQKETRMKNVSLNWIIFLGQRT